MDFKGLIVTALGLNPDASDEEIQKALIAALKPKAEEPGPDALSAAIEKALAVKVAPLTQKIDALSTSNDVFKKELAKRDKQALVDGAGRDGKVVGLSADVLDGMSVEQVRTHVAALAVTVPMDGRNGGANPDGAKKGPSAQQSAIARKCGVDPESVKWAD